MYGLSIEQAYALLDDMQQRERRFLLEIQREKVNDLLDRTKSLDDADPERQLAIRAATKHVAACGDIF